MNKVEIEFIVRNALQSVTDRTLFAIIEEQEPNVRELGGYPWYVRFTDGSQVRILEVTGDDENTILEKFWAAVRGLEKGG